MESDQYREESERELMIIKRNFVFPASIVGLSDRRGIVGQVAITIVAVVPELLC